MTTYTDEELLTLLHKHSDLTLMPKDTNPLFLVNHACNNLSEAAKVRYAETLARAKVNEDKLADNDDYYDALRIHLDALTDLIFATWQDRAIAYLKTVQAIPYY